jgi:DNA-binding transcriptional ArsR family regulator
MSSITVSLRLCPASSWRAIGGSGDQETGFKVLAAARNESFTRAAEELNVTQGAVSHQVKALEETLKIKLFKRERQHLADGEWSGVPFGGARRL